MKKIVSVILLAFSCICGYAQTIAPALLEEMGQRRDNEKIRVFVIMRQQYDQQQLNLRATHFTSRAERRDFVVTELKQFAEASQYDLRHSLSEMQRNGLVTEPKILWIANAISFEATREAILSLADRSDIMVIDFDKERYCIPDGEESQPAYPTREITSNVTQVNADQVWNLGYTGQGVVVAVIDTGVNYNHLDLADHLWDGGAEFPHHGYDVINNDNDPMDDHGHGTHCAGTVCGDGTAGSQTGMAPDATLMCVKCTDSSAHCSNTDVINAMQWSVDHGCDVISMSIVGHGHYIWEQTLIRNACVNVLNAGVIASFAAGNVGGELSQYPIPENIGLPGGCPPPYLDPEQALNPGGLSCSVCVGAVDSNDQAADFTSHGPRDWSESDYSDYPYTPGSQWEFGLIRPDVCAPGVHIKSANYKSNNGYIYMSGTSMAAPCVAGCMALMLSKYPDATPADLCRFLEETAVPLSTGKSNIYGCGRVDALAAVMRSNYDFSAVCSTGQRLYYNITDVTNHYVEITYPGEDSNPWGGFTQPTGNITLPSTATYNGVTYTVTKIGDDAFRSCNDLTGSLTIPNSVTTIGGGAFEDCSGFTGSLTIGNSVTTIYDGAFEGCSGFTGSLTIGTGVTFIGRSAFKNCSGFTQVNYKAVNCADVTYTDKPFEGCGGTLTIGNTVQRIPAYMFYDCTGFTGSLSIPNSVTSIGDYAFSYCSGFNDSLTLGNSVTVIGEHAFYFCDGFNGSLIIPNSVTTIGNYAFGGCSGFTGLLTLGNSVTSIGDAAFGGCSGFTGSLIIPNSVTSIGAGAFQVCHGFTGSLIIPNSVATIGNIAFYNCYGFTGLTIGSSVTSINFHAFDGCSNLSSMTVHPETPPTLGQSVFNNVSTTIPVYVPCPSLEEYQAASGWSSFTNMQCLPETLTVYEGTATNSQVPVNGLWTDSYLKAEFVMPASELADMANGTINSMKFYATQTNVSWGNANFQVFLTEVADATINAFAGPGTIVYQGALSIVGGEMTVNFTTPYPYDGGNLLVGIYNTVKGSYDNSTWYGESVTGASVQGYNTSSLSAITPTQRNFIPKTTFSYTPTDCSSPKDLTETDITSTSATLDWTGYQDSYDLRYRKKPLYLEEFEDGLPSGWTTINNDGDGYNWHSASNYGSSYCHSGSTIMVSASYIYENNTNIALTPDNWLITPLLDLQGTMKVWIRAWHPGFAQEHFAIYLSTTGNSVSDFTTVLVPETTLTDIAYRAYTADLSAYAGQQGYIAIRHFNCTDMYEILLDDFGLFNDPDEIGGWTTLSDIGSSYTLNDLAPDTEYEWQVRGRDCDDEGSFTGWSRAHSFITLSLCPPEDQCELTFTLTDRYGDGWNGAAINVVDVETNILLASMSAPDHGGVNVSSTDVIPLTVCDGRELRFEWVSGNWDSECSYTVTDANGYLAFNGSGAMIAPLTCMVNCDVVQVLELTEGWNWISTYIDLNEVDGIAMLEEALGDYGVTIQTYNESADYFGDGEWSGLEEYEWTNAEMVMVEVSEDCTIDLAGPTVDPSTVEIEIHPGWNWIGFPVATETAIGVAMAGFEAEEEDAIQSNVDGTSDYLDEWVGDVLTLVPGQGYMYYSNSTEPKTLVFSTTAKGKGVFLRKRKE